MAGRPIHNTQKVLGGDSALRAFQSTATVCVPVSHYRTVKSVDSSEESFSDSDEDSSFGNGRDKNVLILLLNQSLFSLDRVVRGQLLLQERR